MSRWSPVISIDIGNDTLKGIVINYTSDGKEILAYSAVKSKGIELGDIKDVVSLNDSMNILIENLEEQVGKILKGDFLVSSSCGNFELREIREELILSEDENNAVVNEKHLDEIKELLLREVINDNNLVYHLFTKRYILDGKKIVFNPVDMTAKKLEAVYSLIIGDTIHRSIVDYATRDTIGEADYFLSTVSAGEAILTGMEKDSGVMHVDMGYHTTVVTVYLNNAPVMLVRIPVAIRHVILDIARVLRTSIYEAERLLKIHGIAMFENIEPFKIEYKALDGRTSLETERERLARIIHARLREIFMKVRRVYRDAVLNFDEFKDLGIPGGIVLSGGGANIARITDVASDIMRCSVRVGNFIYTEDFIIEENENVLNDPMFASTLGNIVLYEKTEDYYNNPVKSRRSFSEIISNFFKKLF
ncbi:cell division protein FtsA [Thermosipho atlanticus]|uniref:Cell division protein FtsA n=1 Tax=Thermosipho atlanticus DSM 15807 TaxID=1123380 RepID=A0A1M5QQ43_9BACT|nr:cell division protein FtsA [Thermosipho atlanticus]SHH15703.1 cell division protein FtsA [Thermosipho atlanticus DSM 15807]